MTIRTHTTILLTALILVLALAGKAQAGEYTIHNCPASLQSNFNAGPWQSYGGSLPSVGGFQGSCTPGSTLGTAIGWFATAQALNSNLGVMLQSPSGITIREMRLVWSVSHQSSGSDTFAEVVSNTGSELIDPTPYSAGSSNPAKVYFPDGTSTVYVYSYCSYDDSANCNFPSPMSPVIKVEGVDTTLEDAVPPTAKINGGSLAAGGPVAGEATLQFTATDGQSGVREAQLLIDGSAVATSSYNSQCSYTSFAACPQSQVNAMTWNSSTVPNGEHRVALRIVDAAGNTQTVDDHAVVLRAKAKRYAEILPHSSLRDLDPVVILATPSERRTRAARAAVEHIPAPLSVTTWNSDTQRSVLATVFHCVTDARSRLPQRKMTNI